MAIVDTDTKSLIINQLTTDQLKELQEAGTVEDGQVYVTIDPLYHDLSNIDAMTADRALITDVNGKIDESSTTATELGYVHGVTSAIQTQLNTKASNDDLALKAPLASPALTGTPTAPTATDGTNTTQIATTAFVNTAISTKAPLASPELTGAPTAPTATTGTNTTQIATTAFVKTAIDNATPGVDNSTVETFDNSSAQGGTTHDLRVKDNGITISKINSSAFTLKTNETKDSATIPSYAKVEEMVANATPVVDDSTISYNSSTELQAIGTINKNGGGALYNWRGTLAEYEAAVAAGTIQSNWICVITDDFNPGVTYAGEIVSVTKTFSTASNHVEFTEKCMTKNYLSVFQDRVFIYPSEYTLDNDFMGITFTSNIEQGSTVTANYFKGVPSEKVDELIEAAETISNYAPAGSVMIWAGTTVPAGYLLCDGSAVSRTTYSALFAAIGTTYGVGDGSSTFNLPNFQDRVIQGAGTRGNVGTYKSESLPNITGKIATNVPATYERVQTGAVYANTFGTSSSLNMEAGSGTNITAGTVYGFGINAFLSSSTYQDNASVQQNALLIQCCIKY